VMSRQSRLAGRLLFPEQHPAYYLVRGVCSVRGSTSEA
jgi:hypothetical protein